ncbi:MAG TPA: hypothetical protein V6D05_05185 [Stenomitos sp.]
MTTRKVTFQQVMIIPALTTLGLGSLLYAQNLSLSAPVDAAPLGKGTPNPALVIDALVPKATQPAAIAAPKPAIAAPKPAKAAPAISLAAPPGAETAQPAPTGPVLNNPEFGTVAPVANDHIRATTKADLVRMARENSGREDPFVALVNPDPAIIQPLPAIPEFRPVKVIPQKILTAPKTVKVATRINAQGNREVVIDPPEAGDEPARGPLVLPKWNLAGVLNTGREQLALLEQDGSTREARLGEILEDGSRVVKIESNKVVLMLNGRRFPKTIGGADAQ